MSNMDFEAEQPAFEAEDTREYDRDRSRSPRRDRGDSEAGGRNRSASPNGRARGNDYHGPPADSRNRHDNREREDNNPGSNLFVTGLAQKVKEEDLRELFAKYGEVQHASIMKDPHSGDSRGFGFVKFALTEHAEAAIEALHGMDLEGRNMSVEKARRGRPRTPTPGKYHGPPKKDDYGFGRRRDDRFGDRGSGGRRRDDYRGGGYGGGSRYGGGDRYGGDRGGDRDRGYGGDRGGGDRRYRERDDYGSSYGGGRIDRYASGGGGGGGGRDDNYRGSRGGGGGGGSGGDDRYPPGGYSGRDERGGAGGYGREAAAPPPGGDAYAPGRGFEDRDSKRAA